MVRNPGQDQSAGHGEVLSNGGNTKYGIAGNDIHGGVVRVEGSLIEFKGTGIEGVDRRGRRGVDLSLVSALYRNSCEFPCRKESHLHQLPVVAGVV